MVDETYVKVAGRWTDLYRAVDKHGQEHSRLVRCPVGSDFNRRRSRVECADEERAFSRAVDELVPTARPILEQYATESSRPITTDSRLGFGRCVA